VGVFLKAWVAPYCQYCISFLKGLRDKNTVLNWFHDFGLGREIDAQKLNFV
jgi:hypothetical protein